MTNLDLSTLAVAEPPYSLYAAIPGRTDFGDKLIDVETATEVISSYDKGLVELPGDWWKYVDFTDPDNAVHAAFGIRLGTSPLTSGFILPHRVVALQLAIRDVVSLVVESRVEIGSGEIQKAEVWAFNYLQTSYPEVSLESLQVLANEFTLSPKQVETLTGIPQSTLALWRSQSGMGRGPAHMSHARAPRYRFATVLAWMHNVAVLP